MLGDEPSAANFCIGIDSAARTSGAVALWRPGANGIPELLMVE